MSKATREIHDWATSQDDIEAQIDQQLAPHKKSQQATGNEDAHVDGTDIYQSFGIEPFHKYIARCERAGKNTALYPSPLVGGLVHVREREIELLETISDEVSYSPDGATHPVLEEQYHRQRAKMLEWIADDRSRIQALTAGGTDIQIHGSPGSGKTTLAMTFALTLQQCNNETVLWADTIDESGTNERTEWLAMAPWTTVAIPAHCEVEVRVVPYDAGLDTFSVGLDEICRDVLRYESPRDLNRQLGPGQFYVVYPDPEHRGCREVSQWSFVGPDDVTPIDEEGPDQQTPPIHWWFAFFATRITHDDFLHPTTLFVDESGNLFDPDSRKDAHESYQKLNWFSKKFADARKKHLSLFTMCHAISEEHSKIRKKRRRWLTMNGSSPPIGKTMPGEKTCPMERDYTSEMDPGQGQVWTTNNYCNFSWPNLKRSCRIDAELSLEFSMGVRS